MSSATATRATLEGAVSTIRATPFRAVSMASVGWMAAWGHASAWMVSPALGASTMRATPRTVVSARSASWRMGQGGVALRTHASIQRGSTARGCNRKSRR